MGLYDNQRKSPAIIDNMFNGKTDDEIIKICRELFGKEISDEYGSRYEKALHNSSEMRYLAERVKEVKMNFKHEEPDEATMRDLGIVGTGTPTSLVTAAFNAIKTEVEAIYNNRIGISDDFRISKEEIKRRFNIILQVYDKDVAQKVIQHIITNAVPLFFFTDSKEEIKRAREDYVEGGPRTFRYIVEALQESGLSPREFKIHDMNIMDVATMLQEKIEPKTAVKQEVVDDSAPIKTAENEPLPTNNTYEESEVKVENEPTEKEIIAQIMEKQDQIDQLSGDIRELLGKLQKKKEKRL